MTEILIIILYLVAINVVGIARSKNKNTEDYFLGSRSIVWPLAALSIVATETSSLTFVSIPGIGYTGGFSFLSVAIGYLAGRIIVAMVFIPRYFRGKLETVYEILLARYGTLSRRVISVIFHVTRFLADGVRLFAAAIPLAMILNWDYWLTISLIGICTFAYTIWGGLRSVVLVDAIQFLVYIICPLLIFYYLFYPGGMSLSSVTDYFSAKGPTGIPWKWPGEPGFWNSYHFLSGLVGGALLTMATHGTDHLMVQRLLCCRNESSGRKALIASGIIVIFQFFLFLLVGVLLQVFFQGRNFTRSDLVLPEFIIHHLTPALRGFMLAGILAAAMSTLASSINALSSSTIYDLVPAKKLGTDPGRRLLLSRAISLAWTAVIIFFAIVIQKSDNPVIEIGLSIASVTFSGVLGIFLISFSPVRIREWGAIAGVLCSILVNIYVIFFTKIFWLWFMPIGLAVCLAVAGLIQLALTAAGVKEEAGVPRSGL